MTNWYTEVSKNIEVIPQCIKHFEEEYKQAKKECSIWGNLEKASAAMPGVVEHRFNQLQELEAILEYLNIEKRRLRSKTFKKFLESYNRVLSSRDADKYVDSKGKEHLDFRKAWVGTKLDMLMNDFDKLSTTEELTSASSKEEMND